MDRKFSTQEAADLLKSWGTPFTKGTLEVWRCRGIGPRFLRIRSRVFYTEEALRQFTRGSEVCTIDSQEARDDRKK